MAWDDVLDVLYEDNHCVAINKPAGWPSAHSDGTTDTLDLLVKEYLRERYAKPGNVFLGVVHRLDKPTTGVLLFARTSKAAARLSEQFRGGGIAKEYWAVTGTGTHPELTAPAGTLRDWLWHDDAATQMLVVPSDTPGAQWAETHYEIHATHGGLTLTHLRPQTGRKHQLRVQLASRGRPIFGDVKYGGGPAFGAAIALHARTLTFLHPVRYEPITLTAAVPPAWRGRFAHLLKDAT
jgi:23S rRNA pseudouridine1911/1915/1917 synthase